MRWNRFLLGLATGVIASYLLVNSQKKSCYIAPEQVVQSLKDRYKDQMSIIGSWIQIEPHFEEQNGSSFHTYHGGLTGLLNGELTFLEFKVDAQTGNILEVKQ